MLKEIVIWHSWPMWRMPHSIHVKDPFCRFQKRRQMPLQKANFFVLSHPSHLPVAVKSCCPVEYWWMVWGNNTSENVCINLGKTAWMWLEIHKFIHGNYFWLLACMMKWNPENRFTLNWLWIFVINICKKMIFNNDFPQG